MSTHHRWNKNLQMARIFADALWITDTSSFSLRPLRAKPNPEKRNPACWKYVGKIRTLRSQKLSPHYLHKGISSRDCLMFLKNVISPNICLALHFQYQRNHTRVYFINFNLLIVEQQTTSTSFNHSVTIWPDFFSVDWICKITITKITRPSRLE